MFEMVLSIIYIPLISSIVFILPSARLQAFDILFKMKSHLVISMLHLFNLTDLLYISALPLFII